jgi:ribosome maturation protein Sdo1
MASAIAMKLEDTSIIIKEMMTVYETDDAAIINEIIKRQGDCQKIAEKRQAEAKRVLKGLYLIFYIVTHSPSQPKRMPLRTYRRDASKGHQS